ncbi:flagellar type III secretion system pore protein FliP [Desulfoluna spongiiphila]|uniref:flagellar type III secretion system pore protein FliP n=1 Tax=Desulfoluna spongiiphila TaxID=419481 RepID=UPI001251DDC2|nr:flagellar type III secretion system pore protein FliP [Desulfoluna spongiiphila]VVS90527.1 flagellar transport protein flip [Desulfoluna spongiiphila]
MKPDLKRRSGGIFRPFGACLLFLLIPAAVWAELPIPSIQIGVGQATSPADVGVALQVLALLTVLALAPTILILMTSFTRVVVVFHFLRQALATQSAPPNQVLVGLALFITFFVMKPVWQEAYDKGLNPYLEEKISFVEMVGEVEKPVKKFMLANTREKDIALFVKIGRDKRPENHDALPLTTLVPAFVISELQTAFIIGFLIYVPFIILDMVVASVLLSMGMMMLPPVMISLPFKLMLFVLVDGWNLIVGSLVKSFGV